jgi:hypothetical protein
MAHGARALPAAATRVSYAARASGAGAEHELPHVGKEDAASAERLVQHVNMPSIVEPAPDAPLLDTVVEMRPHIHGLADRWRLRALYAGGGRGSNEASADALRHMHGVTCVCLCGGLVDYLALHCAPCSQDAAVGSTDGCAGPGCSHRFRPTEYAVSQTRMAVALILGTRLLVLRPRVRRPADVTIVGRAAALRAALAAMSRALALLPVAVPLVATAAPPMTLVAHSGPMTRTRAAAAAPPPSSNLAFDTPTLAAVTSPPSPTLVAASDALSPAVAADSVGTALRARGGGHTADASPSSLTLALATPTRKRRRD